MAIEYVQIYHSYLKAIEPLTDEERGRLFTALLVYSSTGETVDLKGNERFIFPAMVSQIDRDVVKYEKKCERQRINAKKRWQDDAMGCHGMPWDAMAAKEKEKTKTKTKEKEKTKTKEKEIDISNDISSSERESKEKPPDRRHTHGEYKWVRLTDEEYSRLQSDLGQEELDRCIKYVDEAAEKTGNKNRWKNWNLVIRSCHRDRWGSHGKSVVTARTPSIMIDDDLDMLERRTKHDGEKL